MTDETMSNDEIKMQPNTVPKNKIITSENVVTPEVKILNRGDLLGAINCLFPELQLKSSDSLQELTKIFESGRKYRSRTVKNIKLCNANQSMRSLRTDSSRLSSKRNTDKIGNTSTPSKNMVSASKPWKSIAQKKQFTYEMEPSKRYETVPFQSSYTDFVEKFLNSNFPDRFVDFKNVECIIQELHHLHKEMSKEDKIGPFNPNLPVLNISKCDEVLRRKSGSKDLLKSISSTSIKHMRSRKNTRAQIGAKGKRKKSLANASATYESFHKLTDDADDYSYDESGKKIVNNIETLLSNDTFSPRYNEKHTTDTTHRTDLSMIFRKSIDRSDSTIFKSLEKEAIEQYENMDDALDMNFNLSEIEARHKHENEI